MEKSYIKIPINNLIKNLQTVLEKGQLTFYLLGMIKGKNE